MASRQLAPPSLLHDCKKPTPEERITATMDVSFAIAMAGSGHKPEEGTPGITASFLVGKLPAGGGGGEEAHRGNEQEEEREGGGG